MAGTKVLKCQKGCKHEFQDSRYGAGMRVFNVGGTKESPKNRCTVCGSDYIIDTPKAKK